MVLKSDRFSFVRFAKRNLNGDRLSSSANAYGRPGRMAAEFCSKQTTEVQLAKFPGQLNANFHVTMLITRCSKLSDFVRDTIFVEPIN